MNIPKLKHLNSNNFILIAGPCAIEGEEMAFKIAEKILTAELDDKSKQEALVNNLVEDVNLN